MTTSLSLLHWISSVLAIIGLVLLAVNCVLSGRFRWLTGLWSIDAVMRAHQWVGRLVVLIFLLHPLFYFEARVQMTDSGYGSGMLALALLVIVVGFALVKDQLPFRYESWRVSHGLLAVVILLAGLHHVWAADRLAMPTSVLGLLVWFIVVTAVLLVLTIYLVRPFRLSRRPFRVDALDLVAERTWRIRLHQVAGPLLPVRAGQFVWIRHTSPWCPVDHPFSIANDPVKGTLELLVKEAGDFTRHLPQHLTVGQSVYLDGPYGTFGQRLVTGKVMPKGVLLVAGGIGIAPILSVAAALTREGTAAFPIHLVVGMRHPNQFPPLDELRRLEQAGVRLHLLVSEPTPDWGGAVGQTDAAGLLPALPVDPSGWLALVCGPSGMMTSVRHLLCQSGFAPSQIEMEKFKT